MYVGYDYGQVLGLSLLFYEAQRSGTLPATNRIAWRGNSCTNDVTSSGDSLDGGWYDAGGKPDLPILNSPRSMWDLARNY